MAEAKKAERDHTPIYELGNRVARSSVAVIDTVVQRGVSREKNSLRLVS